MASARDIEAGRAFVRLYMKDGLTNPLMSAMSSVRDLGESMAKVGATMTGAGTAIIAAAGGLIKLAANAEQTQVSFEVMLGSADKAKKMIADLRKFAAATPFEFTGLSSAAEMLMGFGIAGDDVMPTLSMLSDVAKGNAEKLQRLALVFGQISSAGRLMGQDLLQLVAIGFNPLQNRAERTGEDMLVLRKRMEQGAFSIEEVRHEFKLATSEGGRFFQMNEKQSKTITGMTSTLKDAFTEGAISIGSTLVKALDLHTILGRLVEIVGKASAAVSAWVAKNQQAIATAAKLVLGITAAGAALTGLGIALSALATPVGALGAALALAFGGALASSEGLRDGMIGNLNEIMEIADTTGAGIVDALMLGDVQLAWDTALASMKLSLIKFMNESLGIAGKGAAGIGQALGGWVGAPVGAGVGGLGSAAGGLAGLLGKSLGGGPGEVGEAAGVAAGKVGVAAGDAAGKVGVAAGVAGKLPDILRDIEQQAQEELDALRRRSQSPSSINTWQSDSSQNSWEAAPEREAIRWGRVTGMERLAMSKRLFKPEKPEIETSATFFASAAAAMGQGGGIGSKIDKTNAKLDELKKIDEDLRTEMKGLHTKLGEALV